MARLTAAERYELRQLAKAINMRARTLAAADSGARHSRLRARYGPGWQGVMSELQARMELDWFEIAERNPYRSLLDPEIGWRVTQRPYLRPANPGRRVV